MVIGTYIIKFLGKNEKIIKVVHDLHYKRMHIMGNAYNSLTIFEEGIEYQLIVGWENQGELHNSYY